MATVWLELRADLRQRWRALLSLALLLGLIGGVVLAAAAGARRTDTAYPRLLSWASASQANIIPGADGYPADYYAALAKLPQVAQLSTAVLYQVVLPTATHADNNQVTAMSSPDHTYGVGTDKVKVLRGRQFDPDAPGQAMIDSQLAALEHVGPGGTLRLYGVPNDPDGTPDFARRVALSFRVTAVIVFDTQVVPIGGGSGSGNIEPTALVSSFPVPGAVTTMSYGNEAAIRLRPGATVDSLTRSATALAKRYPDTNGEILTISQATQQATTQQAIHPQAIALAAFAALAGLIALAVIGQLLSRQLALDAAEFPVLRAIGATRASLVGLSLTRLAIVTLAGGVIAVAIAIAASPLMPIGPARLAEPHPGVEVNLAILGAGFAVIATLPLALLAGAAWRAARAAGGPLGIAEPAQPGRRSRLGGTLTKIGSVTGGVGVAMAFEPGHGRTAVPVRSALAGSVIAVAALTAAAVFGTSLVALVSTPHDYGQNWDAQLDGEFGGVPGALGARVIAAEPAVTGYASGNYGQLMIGGQIVPAIGLDQPPGGGYLTLLVGRAPAGPDEIALGEQTLHAVHARLGQTIPVDVEQMAAGIPAVHRDMRVVGGSRAASLRARDVHAHQPWHRGRDGRIAAVGPLGAQRDHVVPHQGHLLQLLPAPLPARHPRERRRDDPDRLDHQGELPAGLLRGRQRPAAERYQGLRRHPRHSARARRGAHRLRRRHPRARTAHRGAAAAPRPRAAQDPRVHQATGPRRGRLGGQRVRRRRAADRAAARCPGRPLGLGLLRRRGRRPRRRHRPAHRGATRHPGHARACEPHRRVARLDRRPAPPRGRAARGVASLTAPRTCST